MKKTFFLLLFSLFCILPLSVFAVDFKIRSDTPAEKLYFHAGQLLRDSSVEKVNNLYHVKMKDLPRKRQIELHAYWPRSVFAGATDQGLEEERLTDFNRIESNIATEKAQSEIMMKWVFPVIFMSLLLLVPLFYRMFRQSTSIKKVFPKDHRLYEPPMDLPPMVLAEAVYSTSLEEVNPLNKSGFGKFTFERLIQATLLDLVDRGHLSIFQRDEEPYVRIISEKGLSNFEKECLRMTLSNKKELAISELFPDYQVSSSLYRGAKESDEKHIRETGSRLKRSFEGRLQRIQSCVKDKVRVLRIPSYYRPLTSEERRLALGMRVCSAITALGGLLFFYHSWQTHGFFSIPFLLLGLTGLGASFWVYLATRGAYRDGVLTEEGAEIFYLWTSFENMLRDIAHLDQAELESIVLWNRLLVYATLFGYAKKVSKLMKVRHIQLENPDLNLYVAYGWHSQFYTSTAQIKQYTAVANTASTYSVSSGSGSSGGGFSGGGGGGSIGAF